MKKLTGLLLFQVGAFVAAGSPIVLTFSGTGTGILNGTAFDATFTVTSLGDNAKVFAMGATFNIPVSSSTIAIQGFPIAIFSGPTFWADPQGAGDMIFANSALNDGNFTSGLLGIVALFQGLETYQFATSLGPITGFDFLPNIFPNFQNIPTGLGSLTVASTSPLTFTAQVIPEPSSRLLSCVGLLALLSLCGLLRSGR
jgi:hypothetical protein